MNLTDIYSKLSSHLIKGLMVHSQLSSYYAFLGLNGYSKFHQHQYLEESANYANLLQYYTKHHNMLIQDSQVSDPEIIPLDWKDKLRTDISPKDLPRLASYAQNRWVLWERRTKELLQQSYKDLISIGEIASAEFVFKYIEDVDEELAYAESEMLLLESTGYDMSYIADIQNDLFEKYSKKKVKVGDG